MPTIPPELMRRVTDRARDVRTRTYTSGVESAARTVDMPGVIDDFRKHAAPAAHSLLGAFGRLGGRLDSLGGKIATGPDGPLRFGGEAPATELNQPAPAEAIDAAQARIGRELPPELLQLYALADGGFGPGAGLYSLAALVSKYCELTDAPFGPLGQEWPKDYLPLFDQHPALLCIDLSSGAMIIWDPEEIGHLDSEVDWERSFVPAEPSLAATMDAWLDQATLAEDTQDMLDTARAAHLTMLDEGPKSPVTGWPIMVDDLELHIEGEINVLRNSLSLRNDLGLPETGWEDEVRRRHGLL